MPPPIANFFIKGIVQSPLHGLLGPSFAVVAVAGTRTGKVYKTPINISQNDGGYTVVSYRSRTWWRNLRGGKAAQLTTSGKTFPVVGHVIDSPADVAAGLADYFRRHPAYARYFEVRLSPEGKPLKADLEKAASQRVLIQLRPGHPRADLSSAA
jgi:deazaflavin-dependent oxidoreductase (nitroreductase family)